MGLDGETDFAAGGNDEQFRITTGRVGQDVSAFGNAGRGIIEGPGYVLWNLGLQKTVRLERFGAITLVASFQNVLNHTNYGEPSTGGSPLPGQIVVNNANGGKITSTAIFPPAGSPRTGQLGLRWSF